MSILPLLYDDVMERALTRTRITQDDLDALKSTVVYDYTDGMAFAKRTFASPAALAGIPRHPPAPNTWVEWSSEITKKDQTVIDNPVGMRLAVWITETNRDRINLEDDGPHREEVMSLLANAVATYSVNFFLRLDCSWDERSRAVYGKVGYGQNGAILVVTPEGDAIALYSPAGDLKLVDNFQRAVADYSMPPGFLTAADLRGGTPQDDAVSMQSFALTATTMFALLHCKNIVEEQHAVSDIIQKRRKKDGKPKRVVYRTLRVEVPHTVKKRADTDPLEEGSGPKVRLHLCTGHIRHLQSDRYKFKKGQYVFIPAHFRGSEELGRVEGPRKVVAAKGIE